MPPATPTDDRPLRRVRTSPRYPRITANSTGGPAPGRDGAPQAVAREGPDPASCRPDYGRAPLATARAGCGRGERGGCAEGVEGRARERHGCAPCAPEVRRDRHRRAPRAGPRTVRGPRGWKSAYGAGFQPRGCPVGLPWFEMVAIRPFGTTQAPGHRIRDGDAGNSTLPPVLSNTDLRAAWIDRAIARVKVRSAFPAPRIRPEKGPSGPESVTFPASSSPIGPRCGGSPTRPSRKSDFATSLCRLSHERLTSWAPHGGHSLPGPP